MPYDDKTGHSYFESDKDTEHWLSLYVPEVFFYPSPIDQRPRIVPMEDDTPSSPTIPLPEFPLCLQCSDHHHPNAICVEGAIATTLRDAGASIYKEGDVTGSTSEGWGRPIPRPCLRSPLEIFEDCIHCSDKYHDSTMCPTTFMLERCTYCNGNRHSPTQCPSIVTQAFNYAPHVKADPILIPPKPKEGTPTSS
jgi:hypothetical protein